MSVSPSLSHSAKELLTFFSDFIRGPARARAPAMGKICSLCWECIAFRWLLHRSNGIPNSFQQLTMFALVSHLSVYTKKNGDRMVKINFYSFAQTERGRRCHLPHCIRFNFSLRGTSCLAEWTHKINDVEMKRARFFADFLRFFHRKMFAFFFFLYLQKWRDTHNERWINRFFSFFNLFVHFIVVYLADVRSHKRRIFRSWITWSIGERCRQMWRG